MQRVVASVLFIRDQSPQGRSKKNIWLKEARSSKKNNAPSRFCLFSYTQQGPPMCLNHHITALLSRNTRPGGGRGGYLIPDSAGGISNTAGWSSVKKSPRKGFTVCCLCVCVCVSGLFLHLQSSGSQQYFYNNGSRNDQDVYLKRKPRGDYYCNHTFNPTGSCTSDLIAVAFRAIKKHK